MKTVNISQEHQTDGEESSTRVVSIINQVTVSETGAVQEPGQQPGECHLQEEDRGAGGRGGPAP